MTPLRKLAITVSERATEAELAGGSRPYYLQLAPDEERLLAELGLADEVLIEDDERRKVAVVEVLLNRAGL